ncbi:MAG: carbonic anhydrase [Paracoccaceae bacterium]|jgi:carbonic anhydrase
MSDTAKPTDVPEKLSILRSAGVALATVLPTYLTERYRTWRDRRYAENATWYARLANDGQRPRAMIVSCCDSRLDAVAMFGAEPGDLFVVRNVANLIPPYSPDHSHHGTSAAIEYAVRNLKVAHIVIVGHSNCGGVAACHDMCSGKAPELDGEGSFVGRWMDILRPAYEKVAAEGGAYPDQLQSLEKHAVRHSLDNLAGFPFVEEAVKDGLLSLHGAWVDIAKGKLYTLNPESDRFVEARAAD